MKPKRIQRGDGDPRHGTLNGYTNLHCRGPLGCDECRSAMSEHYRAKRGGTTAKQPGRFNVKPSTGNGRKTSEMVKMEIALGLAFPDDQY